MKKTIVLIAILILNIRISASYADVYDKQLSNFKKAVESIETKNWDKAKNEIEKINNPRFHSPNYFYYYKAYIQHNWLLSSNASYKLKRETLISSYENSKMVNMDIELTKFSEKVRQLRLDILENLIIEAWKNKDYFLVIKFSEELSFLRYLNHEEIVNYINSMFNLKLITKGKQVVKNYLEILGRYEKSLTKRTKYYYQKILKEEKEIELQVTHDEKIRINQGESEIVVEDHVTLVTEILNKRRMNKKEVDELFEKLKKIRYSTKLKDILGQIMKRYDLVVTYQSPDLETSYFINKVEEHLSDFTPELILWMANRHWNDFNFDKAELFCETIVKNYPNFSDIPKTEYYWGRILQDAKKYNQAINHFDLIIQYGFGSDKFEYAFFQKAWSYYLLKRYEEAAKEFEVYLANFPSGEHAQASRYFLLKVLKMIKGDQGIIKKWEDELIQNGQIEFYSILYLYNNKRDYPFKEAFKRQKNNGEYIQKLTSTSILHQGKIKRVEELVKLKLVDEAKELLKSIPLTANNIYLLLNYANFLRDEGISLKAIYHTRLIYQEGIIPGITPLQDVFPLRWKKEINRVLSRVNFNVSPYLILSLIRQESAFELKALSSSNAKGPMQLIDSTARMMASNLKLNSFDLFDLKDNILLGISNLKAEYEKFDENIILALAAYNAGPVATSRWQKVRGELPPLEFIESIPYKETRTYVKTILRNYFFYQMIYENKSLQNAKVLVKDLY